mmetsp:Transcript_81270/g.162121  ORF Transcript_81270/g.162121 Transcript_81270/m.162121 type:complete len:286 (+) Transcript_81270:495-1352(+)
MYARVWWRQAWQEQPGKSGRVSFRWQASWRFNTCCPLGSPSLPGAISSTRDFFRGASSVAAAVVAAATTSPFSTPPSRKATGEVSNGSVSACPLRVSRYGNAVPTTSSPKATASRTSLGDWNPADATRSMAGGKGAREAAAAASRSFRVSPLPRPLTTAPHTTEGDEGVLRDASSMAAITSAEHFRRTARSLPPPSVARTTGQGPLFGGDDARYSLSHWSVRSVDFPTRFCPLVKGTSSATQVTIVGFRFEQATRRVAGETAFRPLKVSTSTPFLDAMPSGGEME